MTIKNVKTSCVDLMKSKSVNDPVEAINLAPSVTFDMTAPIYWWDKFKLISDDDEIANDYVDDYPIQLYVTSMAKLRDFELSDFSYSDAIVAPVIEETVRVLNFCRKKYLDEGNSIYLEKILELLPVSYNIKKTVVTDYCNLRQVVLAGCTGLFTNDQEWVQFKKEVEDFPEFLYFCAKVDEHVKNTVATIIEARSLFRNKEDNSDEGYSVET